MSTTMKKDQGTQAKEQAGQAYDKVKEAAGHVGEAATSAASAVGQTADKAAETVGGGMQNLADTVRDSGPKEGVLGTANRTVAAGLEGAGKYIEDKQISGMVSDIGGLITRNPIPAVLLALGVGFLVGRALSSSRS